MTDDELPKVSDAVSEGEDGSSEFVGEIDWPEDDGASDDGRDDRRTERVD